jgi:hypothetical protein
MPVRRMVLATNLPLAPGAPVRSKEPTMNKKDLQLKLGTKVPTAIYFVNDEPVCVVDSMQERIDDKDVAERLVACWNACLGMSTKSLSLMAGNYYGAIQHSRDHQDNDELFNARLTG